MIRLTRGRAFRDKLRAYKIYIDDVYRGDIRQNKTKRLTFKWGMENTLYMQK